ncbi:MAG: hypothetical protein ACKOKF_11340, partial [Bacteroidota bacterium]
MCTKIPLVAILLFTASCSNTSDNKLVREEIPPSAASIPTLKKGILEEHRISIKGNHPYSVYIPSTFDSLQRLPVTILLDPQGAASEVISKYSFIAENHRRILVCSEDFKNGMDADASLQVISSLIEEAIHVLRADPSAIHLMGFSGGARASIIAGGQIPGISSLTYCGAAPPSGSISLRIPSLGIAGIRDMNFTEVLYFTSSLDTTFNKPTMLATATHHEWPDTATFRIISGWAEIVSCRKSTRCDSTIIQQTATLTKARIKLQRDPILRDLLLRFMVTTFDGFIPLNEENKEMQNNLRSREFGSSLNAFRTGLQFETAVRQEFADAFKAKDLNWWKPRIDDLMNK